LWARAERRVLPLSKSAPAVREHPGAGHEEMPLMPDPTVRAMLVAKVDELVAMTRRDLDEIRAVTDQLEPDRAQSCRVVVGMCRVILDEVRLRAAARPLVEPEP
jgi:hypothetical protein